MPCPLWLLSAGRLPLPVCIALLCPHTTRWGATSAGHSLYLFFPSESIPSQDDGNHRPPIHITSKRWGHFLISPFPLCIVSQSPSPLEPPWTMTKDKVLSISTTIVFVQTPKIAHPDSSTPPGLLHKPLTLLKLNEQPSYLKDLSRFFF